MGSGQGKGTSSASTHSEPNSKHLFTTKKVPESDAWSVTPSIAFRHLPPNSATFGYVTEGALFISAQLSTDTVVAPPERSGYQ